MICECGRDCELCSTGTCAFVWLCPRCHRVYDISGDEVLLDDNLD